MAATLQLFISIGFVLHAFQTEGVIFRFAERIDKDGATTRLPVFAFVDAEGVERTAESSFVSPFRRVGQRVPILYIPREPTEAEIASFGPLWGMPTAFASIALVFVSGSLLLHRWPRRAKLTSPS